MKTNTFNKKSGARSFGRTFGAPLPPKENKAGSKFISKLYDGNIRLISFSGVEEIGRNMFALEYMDTIIVIDAGVQFNELKSPGIDFVIPNASYLEENKHKIKALIVTSSKLEHMGAVPYLYKNIGAPTVYARHYTSILMQNRFKDLGFDAIPTIVPIEDNITIPVGNFKVNFWNVSNTSADSLSVSLTTPYGDIVYTNDTQVSDPDKKFKAIVNNKILCLIADSAYAEMAGVAPKMDDVKIQIQKVFTQAKNKILVATFPSNIEHIIIVLDIAREMKKKVIIESKVIKDALAAAQEIGIAESYKDILLDVSSIDTVKNSDLVVFLTGAEGLEFEQLQKIANATHKHITLSPSDTIIIAANSITHNQRNIQNLKDTLSRLGAHIVHFKSNELSLNNSGYSEDLRTMHTILKPMYFMPIRGCHYMLRVHADIARKMSVPENHIIIPDDGMIMEIRDDGKRITNTREKVASELVVLDGAAVGKVQEVVMRDRETLSGQGVFIIMILVDGATHKLKKAPDIASRGFVYLKESQELLYDARALIKTTVDEYLIKNKNLEIDELKADLQFVVSKLLLQKTAKEPVIIPIIIKV